MARLLNILLIHTDVNKTKHEHEQEHPILQDSALEIPYK